MAITILPKGTPNIDNNEVKLYQMYLFYQTTKQEISLFIKSLYECVNEL